MKRFIRLQRRALDRMLKKRALETGMDSARDYLERMQIREGPPVPPLHAPDPDAIRFFRRYLWFDVRARAAVEADESDTALLVGTPVEVIAAIDRVEEAAGRAIRDVWPSLRGIILGGTAILPFRETLRLRIGSGVRFVEILRPSSGVTLAVNGKLRPLKHAYLEFVPVAGGPALAAHELHSGVDYRVLVTDGDELWRQDGGEVVRFAGPRRVVRVRNRFEAGSFGERLREDDVEAARGEATALHLVPEYPTAKEPHGRYRLEASYVQMPDDLEAEGARIDTALREACDGYRRLREAGTLRPPWLRLTPLLQPRP
ncbi:MAG: GH3 auxin-responsive promoter family protein [Planctomycetota bacterium]